VQITAPSEFQGNIIGDVNRRKGIIQGSEQEGDDVVINVRQAH
jgi:elongation factor G